MEDIPTALAFDDVLIIPQKGVLVSRLQANVESYLTNKIKLKVPIISSNMDTVTESKMAIALAQMGGLGIIHRYCSIERQAQMVRSVKRAENFVIESPYITFVNKTVLQIRNIMEKLNVGSLMVLQKGGGRKCAGIITTRDIRFREDTDLVEDLMTTVDNMVYVDSGLPRDKYSFIMTKKKVKKLPLLDPADLTLKGLVCAKDILKRNQYPDASRDNNGQLMVGAAIGLDDINRASELIDAGADTLVIDVAHGHCNQMVDFIKKFKTSWPHFPLGAGNVATYEGYRDLVKAGADWVKLGVGSGSICETRLVSGAGVPTFQSILDCKRRILVEKNSEKIIGLVADGGIKNSGDIAKSIGAGADIVMLGSLLAGTDESPGIPIVKNGKKVKIIRGMAGIGANWDRKSPDKIVPEGVEAVVEFKGPVRPIISQLVGGLKSGMSYSGNSNINDMKIHTRFYRQTMAGARESASHDVKKI